MYRGSKARETWEQQRRKRKNIWKNTKREDISRMFSNYKLPTGGGNNHVKLAYSKPLKVATLNVRGMKSENAMTKGALIADIMKKQHYDVMLLQETNENTKSVRTIQGFDFYFSTDIKQEEILKTKTRIEEAKAKGKGTSSTQKTDVERAGVAIVVSPQIRPFVKDVRQISGRIISLELRAKGRNLHFTSCYAPHSGYDTDSKSMFYNDLSKVCRKAKGVHYLGGDMNARLHYRFHSEENVLGPHIFGRGREYLNSVSDATLENRYLFMTFCQQNGLNVLNTFFRKQAQEYCTFRENTTKHGPEWTPTRYAQLDFWLADESRVRSCKGVRARTDIYFPSDHYIVEANFVVKLQGVVDKPKSTISSFRQPNTEEWQYYNQLLSMNLSGATGESWNEVATTIMHVAQQSLTTISNFQKKSYISRSTWQAIQDRQTAHEQGRQQDVEELNKFITKNAKQDKKNTILNGLRDLPNQKEKWQGIRGLKTEARQRFIQMRDLDGKFVPPRKRAECIARYLEQKHWSNNSATPVTRNEKIRECEDDFDTSQFEFQEFDKALKSMKNNKQPGPDGLIMELFKWMSKEKQELIVGILNKWWIQQAAPEEVFLARVVSIYKKGDTDQPSNYRPISLLNSIYKLYMCLVRNRIQIILDNTLCETQYGFRPSRSTSHAIYLTRRLQDIAEQKGTNLVITLLDWEKAFDKIQHDRLYIALSRLGLSSHFINVIRNGYSQAKFFYKG